MSIHIHKFVDLIKAAESRNQRDLLMNLRDAKDLHADITKLLITMEQLRNLCNTASSQEQTITVELDGGGFKNT